MFDEEYGVYDDDDYEREPDEEQLCINCSRETAGDVCDECGGALCPMCAECGAMFCEKHPSENYNPYAELQEAI